MGLEIILTDDKVISQKAFDLRKKIFSQKYKIDFPEEKPQYKDQATWLLAINEKNEIVSTIRLIYDRDGLKDKFRNRVSEHYLLHYPDYQCLEMATVIVLPQYSKTLLLYNMLIKVVEFAVAQNLYYICGIVDEDFASMIYKNQKNLRYSHFKMAIVTTEILGEKFFIPAYNIFRIGIGAEVNTFHY